MTGIPQAAIASIVTAMAFGGIQAFRTGLLDGDALAAVAAAAFALVLNGFILHRLSASVDVQIGGKPYDRTSLVLAIVFVIVYTLATLFNSFAGLIGAQ